MSEKIRYTFITTTDLIDLRSATGSMIRCGAVGVWDTKEDLVVFRPEDIIPCPGGPRIALKFSAKHWVSENYHRLDYLSAF